MKKFIKYILIFVLGVFIMAISVFYYFHYDCYCTLHTYYTLKNRMFYYGKIDEYIGKSRDSIIDWKPLISTDTTLEIISINNKKDSLEFFVVNKEVKFNRISYYYDNKFHLYRTLQSKNNDFKSTIREKIDDGINNLLIAIFRPFSFKDTEKK